MISLTNFLLASFAAVTVVIAVPVEHNSNPMPLYDPLMVRRSLIAALSIPGHQTMLIRRSEDTGEDAEGSGASGGGGEEEGDFGDDDIIGEGGPAIDDAGTSDDANSSAKAAAAAALQQVMAVANGTPSFSTGRMGGGSDAGTFGTNTGEPGNSMPTVGEE